MVKGVTYGTLLDTEAETAYLTEALASGAIELHVGV